MFRQTDPKPRMLHARTPAELTEALKSLAYRRDMTLSAVVRQALATGAKIMLEAEAKAEVAS